MYLRVEHRSIELAASLRDLLKRLERCDRDLASQLRRATGSIALNIAEGLGRVGKDRLHHYRVARGSALEVDAALRLAVAWGYLSQEGAEQSLDLVEGIQKMLSGLLK